MSWARCSVCDTTFTSDSGFDRHRIMTKGRPGYDPEYDWRCASPAELRGRGYSQNDKGWWYRDGDSGPTGGSVADLQPINRAEAEAYDRHRDFISWAEQDRREESQYADEEPRV